jgi:hypothetical protein
VVGGARARVRSVPRSPAQPSPAQPGTVCTVVAEQRGRNVSDSRRVFSRARGRGLWLPSINSLPGVPRGTTFPGPADPFLSRHSLPTRQQPARSRETVISPFHIVSGAHVLVTAFLLMGQGVTMKCLISTSGTWRSVIRKEFDGTWQFEVNGGFARPFRLFDGV